MLTIQNFIDYNWQSYTDLQRDVLQKYDQIKKLYYTGLCEYNGVEFSFIPTIRFQKLENESITYYNKLKVVDWKCVVSDEVFYTSKIEGANTTIKRTQEIYDGAPVDQDNYFSEMMLLGNFKATEYLNKLPTSLSVNSLIECWNILTDGCCNNTSIKGTRFRIGNVQVGNHVGLNPDLIEQTMLDWVNYYNSDTLSDHPFIKAALLHFTFEFIHPFCDGNGRMGRLLQNNFLIRNGFEKIKAVSFSKLIDSNRAAYDNALQLGDNAYTDCTAFIEYMLNVYANALFNLT